MVSDQRLYEMGTRSTTYTNRKTTTLNILISHLLRAGGYRYRSDGFVHTKGGESTRAKQKGTKPIMSMGAIGVSTVGMGDWVSVHDRKRPLFYLGIANPTRPHLSCCSTYAYH